MGNCTNTKSSSQFKKSDKQLKAIQIVRDEIEKLKEEQLFNQALMKMNKLVSLLKIHRKENTYYQEVMELYIEMGRINQDVVGNHHKAQTCFENAIEMSMYAYGQNNDIATKIITPFLIISNKYLEEANGPLKQLQQKPSSPQDNSGRKYIKRSSTHATTRVSAIPPSLNIIMEESSEHEEEGIKHWDEKEIVNTIFNKNKERNITEMLTSV